MIALDKIKIVSDIQNISVVDENRFKKIVSNGIVSALKYNKKTPYELIIKLDYVSSEFSIEFTGKILGKLYPKLITQETIRLCFENINALGFCKIDIDKVMSNAEVVKADITKDVKGINVEQLRNFIQSHIVNYHHFTCKMTNGNKNLEIQKNVVSGRCKKRITIYDKEKEMNKAKNIGFSVRNGLEHSFDNACRFELNLNSKKQVRESLCIQDNKLSSVLSSQANPIYDFLNEIVVQTEPINLTNWKSYTKYLVLKDCNFNLEAVEKKLRSLYPRGNNYGNLMKPYRAMMVEIDKDDNPNYWQDIMNQLS